MNNYFDQYAQKGNEFLEVLAVRMGRQQDTATAARILRVVLHTIRDIVPANISLKFLSSLPMAIKALYVDGWKGGQRRHPLKSKEDFITAIRNKEKPLLAAHDMGDDSHFVQMIRAVLQTLELYVSEGEQRNLLAVLPNEIRSFMEELLSEKFHVF